MTVKTFRPKADQFEAVKWEGPAGGEVALEDLLGWGVPVRLVEDPAAPGARTKLEIFSDKAQLWLPVQDGDYILHPEEDFTVDGGSYFEEHFEEVPAA